MGTTAVEDDDTGGMKTIRRGLTNALSEEKSKSCGSNYCVRYAGKSTPALLRAWG
jgi:hypothetical protein